MPKPHRVTIHWMPSHHVADDESMIMRTLEAGYDEGPLISIEARSRRAGGRPAHAASTIFADSHWYLAHLAHHADDLEGERWVGLIRGTVGANDAPGLTVLRQVQRAIAPQARRRPTKASGTPPPQFDYGVIAEIVPATVPVHVEHVGEELDDVFAVFPQIAEIKTVQPPDSD